MSGRISPELECYCHGKGYRMGRKWRRKAKGKEWKRRRRKTQRENKEKEIEGKERGSKGTLGNIPRYKVRGKTFQ